MNLHGALIIAEQSSYEGILGPIDSVDTLLELLQHNPWFTWLHPIADVLVRIDYLLQDDAFDITDDSIVHLIAEVEELLHPSVEGDGFGRAYYEALQRAPQVVVAHRGLKRLLPKAA